MSQPAWLPKYDLNKEGSNRHANVDRRRAWSPQP